jgi:GDPmannose 4,6-dehydratase
MWLMLQQKRNLTITLPDGLRARFLRVGFSFAGLNNRDHVVTRDALRRPAEVDFPQGDASKARRHLKWDPMLTLEDLVAEMVEAGLKRHRANMSQ